MIAAKAISFFEALSDRYATYAQQVIKNAQTMSQELTKRGYNVVSGGTDNHLMLVDLQSKNMTGAEAEDALGKAGITINKNMVPFDTQSPFVTSGIRLGSPAITTRGMVETDATRIIALIDEALTHRQEPKELAKVKQKVRRFVSKFPLYK